MRRLRGFGFVGGKAWCGLFVWLAWTVAGAAAARAADVATSPVSPAPVSADASTLTGDWGGRRVWLDDHGLDFSLAYNSESAANPVGGLEQGVRYSHQINFGLDVDFQRLAGFDGLKLHFLIINRIGRNLSADKIGNLFQVQEDYGGDGPPYARIVFLTLEQSLFDGRLNFVAGRTNAGADFAFSLLYGNFQNVAVDAHPNSLPANGGFNVFPFSLWGGRARVRLAGDVYFQSGLYQVDPSLNYRAFYDWGIEQARGVIVPFELGWTPASGPDRLPGHYKLGGFWDTSSYPDLRDDAHGHPYVFSGLPPDEQTGRGAFYALADQMLVRTGQGDGEGLIVLGGLTISDPDTAFFDRFGFGGVIYRGFLSARPDDFVSLLCAYGHVNDRLQDTQRDQRRRGQNVGVQTSETVLEFDYGWQVAPWLRLTPNVQGILRPGGTGNIPDALVAGIKVDAAF